MNLVTRIESEACVRQDKVLFFFSMRFGTYVIENLKGPLKTTTYLHANERGTYQQIFSLKRHYEK